MSPRITVLTGPAGSGKTATCVTRYVEGLGRARVVVPTAAHALHVRALATAAQCGDPVGITSFGELIRDIAAVDQTQIISPSFRRLALAAIVDDAISADGYFGRMRGASGFASALGEMIQELRLSGIEPQALKRAASEAAPQTADPLFVRKANEVARLYCEYERFLASHGLVDEESLPALAARRVAGMKERLFDALLVDGFHRLSRAWRDLLAALARSGVDVTITLTLERDRPLLFAAPLRTLRDLRSEFELREDTLTRSPGDRPPLLVRLESALFGDPSVHAGSNAPGTIPVDDPGTRSLIVFDAPNPYVEVEMVARAIAREHHENGTPWNRCVILLRSPGDYGPTLSSVFERYGIPLSLTEARPLAEAPAARSLTALLRVLTAWQRADVVAFLRSSVAGGQKLAAEQLGRRARRAGIRAGREPWEAFCGECCDRGIPLSDRLKRILEWNARLRDGLSRAREYVQTIRLMAEDFGLLRRDNASDREMLPLNRALEVAEDLGSVLEAMGRDVLPFDSFARELMAAWRFASYVEEPRTASVVALEPYDARQAKAEVAVVMGLVERRFPRRVIDDPFFRDDERAALTATGTVALEGRQDRSDDERLLFYLSVTSPSRRLILSFPRSADDADALPSFYVDEVRAAVGSVPTEVRTLADIAPRPEECVNERDRLLAALTSFVPGQSSDSGAQPEDGVSAAEQPRSADRSGASVEEHAGTRALQTAVEVIHRSAHLPPLPRIQDQVLRDAYSGGRRYRVTEIEDYNRCPFQHFMRYGIAVSPDETGGGPADRGTLYHAALSRCYRRSKARPHSTPLVEDLQQEMSELLRSEAVDAPPHRKRMLERFLMEAAAKFADRENYYGPRFGLSPAYFELAFGMDAHGAESEEDPGGRQYDGASTGSPLAIDAEGARSIQLCGVIDRVDLWPDGLKALAIDYKTGDTPTYAAMQAGHSIQMPLYLMALEQLWGKIGAVACHDSPREPARRRFFRVEHADVKQFGMDADRERGRDVVKPVTPQEYLDMTRAVVGSVVRAVDGISSAEIRPTPGEHCRFCSYGDCCRTTPDSAHDGEPYDIMTEQ